MNQLATSVDAAAPGQVVAAADAVGARPATLLGGGVLLFAALALAGGGKGDRTPRRGSETGSSDGADPTPNAEPVKASAKAVKEASAPKASAPKASAPEASSTDRLERIREMNRANEAAVAEAEAKLKQAASFAKKAEKEVDAKLKKSAVVAKMDAAAQRRAEQKRKAEEELAAEYQRGPEEGARGGARRGCLGVGLQGGTRECRAVSAIPQGDQVRDQGVVGEDEAVIDEGEGRLGGYVSHLRAERAPPVPNRLPSTENFHLSVSSIAATVRGNTQNKGDTEDRSMKKTRGPQFSRPRGGCAFFFRLHFQAIFFLRTHHRARRLNKNRLTCG